MLRELRSSYAVKLGLGYVAVGSFILIVGLATGEANATIVAGIVGLLALGSLNAAETLGSIKEVNYPCLLAAFGGSLRQGLPGSTTRFGETLLTSVSVFPGSAVSTGVDSAMP